MTRLAEGSATIRPRPAGTFWGIESAVKPSDVGALAISGPTSWEWRGNANEGTLRCVGALVNPSDAGSKNLMIGLCRIPQGQAAPLHHHEVQEEFIYVLEGEGEFVVGGEDGEAVERVTVGSFNLIPPGVEHCHRASTDRDLLFVWGYSPPGPPPADRR